MVGIGKLSPGLPFLSGELVQGHVVHGSQHFSFRCLMSGIFDLKTPGFFYAGLQFAAESLCADL